MSTEDTIKHLHRLIVKGECDDDVINLIKNVKYKSEYQKDLINIFSVGSVFYYYDVLPYSYKKKDYINFLVFLTDFIIDIDNCRKRDTSDKCKYNIALYRKILRSLITNLCKTNKGQYQLTRLEVVGTQGKLFKEIFKNNLECFLYTAVASGTLVTFIFALKYVDKNWAFYKKAILSSFLSSNRNSDSRVYEYFLKNEHYLSMIREKLETDSCYIKKILSNVASLTSTKYFLKRMRKLDKFFNLKPYTNIFYNHFNILQFVNILPYYANKSFFSNIGFNLIDDVINYFEVIESGSSNLGHIIIDPSVHKLDYNKFIYKLESNNTLESVKNFKLILKKEFDKDFEYNLDFIRMVAEYSFYKNMDIFSNKDFYKFFVKNFKGKNIYLEGGSLPWITLSDCIVCDYQKELLVIKRFLCKILNIKYKTNFLVKSFEQKEKIDNFTTIPPHHIFNPNIEGNILLRPKADGTLVSSINNNVYPLNLLNNYIIKAEYIKELDLYLVFDINLPFRNSRERYRYLREMHPYTTNHSELVTVNSLNDIIKANNKEDLILRRFLDDSNGKRWFPKISFDANLTKEEYSVLLGHTSINSRYNNAVYHTDGYVIHMNNKEYKLKPYDLMTIDISYDTSKRIWKDRENNDLSMYMSSDFTPVYDSIWRCYPVIEKSGVKFFNKEIREDKKRPNQSKVINQIIDYLESLRQDKYYQKSEKPSSECLDIIKRQSNRFTQIISRFNSKSKSWLDLGCGKGKLLYTLEKFMVYFGIDNDYNVINRNKEKFSGNRRAIFKQANVEEDSLIDILPPLKFDFIVMNHCINHFYGKNLLQIIDRFTKPGSTIIFNITNDNLRNNIINIGNGFIKNDNSGTEYLFPWAHSNSIKEKFISSNQIKSDFSNFRIMESEIFDTTEFESIYTWYIMKKV